MSRKLKRIKLDSFTSNIQEGTSVDNGGFTLVPGVEVTLDQLHAYTSTNKRQGCVTSHRSSLVFSCDKEEPAARISQREITQSTPFEMPILRSLGRVIHDIDEHPKWNRAANELSHFLRLKCPIQIHRIPTGPVLHVSMVDLWTSEVELLLEWAKHGYQCILGPSDDTVNLLISPLE
jgi:hypothetical protein